MFISRIALNKRVTGLGSLLVRHISCMRQWNAHSLPMQFETTMKDVSCGGWTRLWPITVFGSMW